MCQKTFLCFNIWCTNLGRVLYSHLIEHKHCCWVSMWWIHMAVMMCVNLCWCARLFFCQDVFCHVIEVVRKYFIWHGWNIFKIFLSALAHMLMFTHSQNNNPPIWGYLQYVGGYSIKIWSRLICLECEAIFAINFPMTCC